MSETGDTPSRSVVEARILGLLADRLEATPAEMDPTVPFSDLGLRSTDALGLVGELEEWLGRPLSESLLYRWPTARRLAGHLAGDTRPAEPATASPPGTPPEGSPRLDVAVTGMACRFPGGGADPERFWDMLLASTDAVGPAPDDRWPDPARTPFRGAFLGDVAGWDAALFGLSPAEAVRIDPQHRLLTEIAWEALEDAGIAPDGLGGSRTGVFVGAADSYQYAQLQQEADPDSLTDPHVTLGTSASVASGRLAYLFDLRGPAVTVDTACSSSLVALHLAVQSLRAGECDLAVVGGVSVIAHHRIHAQARRMAMLAADDRCKTFDEAADGYVLGEGCGGVVLERLPDARRNRRRIRALLRGSAINQDGRSNGLTAPNGAAQSEVVRRALGSADVTPAEVAFVEAHGTGTKLGDGTELSALQEVFAGRGPDDPLWVGAVKTNVGHLLAAAGMAGLVKTVLTLEAATLPPNLHLNHPNAALRRDRTVRPAVHAQDLATRPGGRLVAGVSSFGWSGTNAHLVLERATPPAPAQSAGDCVVVMSAATQPALRRAAEDLADALRRRPDLRLADVARTLREGRNRFPFRLAMACRDRAGLLSALDAVREAATSPTGPGVAPGRRPRLALLLGPAAGQPSRAAIADLHAAEPAFRIEFDSCLSSADPTASAEPISDLDPLTAAFCAQVALVRTLVSWGLRPDRVDGGTAGRVVGAVLDERSDLRTALAAYRSTAPAGDDGTAPDGDITVEFDWGLGGRCRVAADPDTVPAIPAFAADPAPPVRSTSEWLRQVVCRLWEHGREPDWAAFDGDDGRIVSLPHYPFERRRLWPIEPRSLPEPAREHGAPVRPVAEWLHFPSWRPEPRPADAGRNRNGDGVTVVFADTSGIAARFCATLRAGGRTVWSVDAAAGYSVAGDSASIDPSDGEHYRRLLTEIADRYGERTLSLVHLWSLRPPPMLRSQHRDLAPVLRLGFHSVTLLAQAVGSLDVDSRTDVLIVTAGALGVTAPDGSAPERALVHGLGRVLRQEYDFVACRAVDLDPDADAGDCARHVREEWAASAPAGTEPADVDPVLTAWRSGRRWRRHWMPADAPQSGPDGEQPAPWRPDGAYLITGGTRGLGMMLARHLAGPGTRRLALVGRRPLPDRAGWSRWIAAHGPDDETSATLREITAMERGGTQVLPLTADVGDPGQLAEALRRTREQFGALHGIVHAAGVPGDGLVQHKSRAAAETVLQPKVPATLRLLDELPALDFLVLYSSAVSVIGGIGEADYCAANAFLDACASSARAASAGRLVSVAWGPWQHDSWTAGTASARTEAARRTREYRDRFGISEQAGVGVLTRILAGPHDEVLVLPQPLDEAARWWGDLGRLLGRTDPVAAESRVRHPRPALRVPFQPPRPGAEERVAAVWRACLGIEPIGAVDPFFDLGGNSLLAVTIRAQLQQEFGLALPPEVLFAHPTIRELAGALGTTGGEPAPHDVTDAAARGARRSQRGPTARGATR